MINVEIKNYIRKYHNTFYRVNMRNTMEETNKDKIIQILREEIALIKRMNYEVLNEKDKLITNLHNIIQEQEKTIETLKKRLKQEGETEFLIV
jgi:hypothetical protein